jgi:hypothetical protein
MENVPEQSSCGNCGAALVLKDYITAQVSKELATTIRDRDVLETDSAVKVFERAFRWAKLTFGIFTGAVGLVLVVVLALSGWRASDFLKAVDVAKDAVVKSSAQSIGEVQKASKEAIDANHKAATNAIQLSRDMKNTASQTTTDLKGQAASVRNEVTKSKTELEAVHRLQPEFEVMRAQLGKATSDLAAQQKVISSSEEFVKKVFSTHATYIFGFKDFDKSNAVVIPASQGTKNTVVYMLVPNAPIDGTLQLQYKIYVQPPGSYIHIHNLILFFWGDPADNLKTDTLAVSFFPDNSDKETIKALTVRDGRVYADDQPLPKFGQPDPDWKGNKWMPLGDNTKP